MLLNVVLAVFSLRVGPGEDLAVIRDRIRALPEAVRDGGVEVVLSPGRYSCSGGTLRLDAADSGRAGAPVVWRGSRDGGVVFSQGREIPRDSFSRVADRQVLARLPDPAVQVLVADLSEMRLDLGAPLRGETRYPLPIPELYVDGRRMMPAEWPNDGKFVTIARFVREGTRRTSGNAWAALLGQGGKKDGEPPSGGVFGYDGDRPSRWTTADSLTIRGYWCFDWNESALPVKAVDTTNRTIEVACPTDYGIRQGNPSPRRWKAVNLLEELDARGEFFVDRGTRKLYLCPPDGFSATSRIAIVGCGMKDMVLCGNVTNVTFRGIGFEEGYGNAVRLENCVRVGFDRCSFRNLRRKAVEMAGCSNCVLRMCDVLHTGTGGVVLKGGDRRTLTPGNNRAVDCVFRAFSEQKPMYSPAVSLAGVGNAVRNCEISDAAQMAISIHGNDNVVECNVISNVCTCSDDAAALYKGRNPSCRGNLIRHNLWKDIGSRRGHGTAAIYFDDGDGGDIVFGNIFVRCGEPGQGSFGTVFSHGGYSNVVENCIFVDCIRPLGSAPWSQKRWTECLRSVPWLKALTQDVDICSEVYLGRYPGLAGFLDPHPDELRWNAGFNNAFVGCGEEVSKGRWALDESNVKIAGDAGFVDAKHGNYELKRTSVIYKKIKGFSPIPFERIGLRTRGAERRAVD